MIRIMEAVYGKQECKKSLQPNWSTLANRADFLDVPRQGPNQCGFYCLKFASTYDGVNFVETIHSQDVCSYSNYIFLVCYCVFGFYFLVGFRFAGACEGMAGRKPVQGGFPSRKHGSA